MSSSSGRATRTPSPRKGGKQPENWDRLFDKRSCTVIPAGKAGDRASFLMPALEPDLVRMMAVTQVPAVFCSQEGKETQMLLPTTLGGNIKEPFDVAGKGYKVKVSTPLPAEILLYAPEGGSVTVNGKEADATPVTLGATRFLRVAVPAGESDVELR